MDMIETKALEFAYPAEEGEKPVLALRGVDTAIEKGSFVVVLGHNGSGKSTFAKSLNAILLPCGGKVYVEGMDTQDEACLLEIRRSEAAGRHRRCHRHGAGVHRAGRGHRHAGPHRAAGGAFRRS